MSWHTIRASAHDHPNVVEDREVIPGGPSRAWIEDVRDEYGEESPYYVARVDARFPQTATDSLVRQDWLDAAVQAHEDGRFREDEWRHVVGVDVARKGPDSTVMAIRQGRHVVEFREWQGLDTEETAERVLGVCGRLHDGGKSPVRTVVVDATAVGGGVADKLKRTLPRLQWHESGRRGRGLRTKRPKLVEFVGGSKAKDTERFLNLRAQGYWHLRRLLEKEEIALPNDPDLMEELRHTRWETTADGKVKIEPKDDTKARLGGASPDRADALSMTYLKDLESSEGYSLAWR